MWASASGSGGSVARRQAGRQAGRWADRRASTRGWNMGRWIKIERPILAAHDID